MRVDQSKVSDLSEFKLKDQIMVTAFTYIKSCCPLFIWKYLSSLPMLCFIRTRCWNKMPAVNHRCIQICTCHSLRAELIFKPNISYHSHITFLWPDSHVGRWRGHRWSYRREGCISTVWISTFVSVKSLILLTRPWDVSRCVCGNKTVILFPKQEQNWKTES